MKAVRQCVGFIIKAIKDKSPRKEKLAGRGREVKVQGQHFVVYKNYVVLVILTWKQLLAITLVLK